MAIKEDTQNALFEAIKTTTAAVMEANGNPTVRGRALQILALAYRYTAGGMQPGASSTAE